MIFLVENQVAAYLSLYIISSQMSKSDSRVREVFPIVISIVSLSAKRFLGQDIKAEIYYGRKSIVNNTLENNVTNNLHLPFVAADETALSN